MLGLFRFTNLMNTINWLLINRSLPHIAVIQENNLNQKSAPQFLLLSLIQVFYLSLWFDWQLRTHVGALWGAAVGWWPVPVTPATMVTRPTVLGSLWPNLETPSLSSLQTSRLRRSTTTWKWRGQNHQLFGELTHLYYQSGVCVYVCARDSCALLCSAQKSVFKVIVLSVIRQKTLVYIRGQDAKEHFVWIFMGMENVWQVE